MSELAVVGKEIKQFKLSNEPVMFALSYHFNNVFTYFSPCNEGIRIDNDKSVYAYPAQILSVFQWLLHNEQYVESYIEMRHIAPIEFRCAQMIQHYGSKTIKEWIELFYGKVL